MNVRMVPPTGAVADIPRVDPAALRLPAVLGIGVFVALLHARVSSVVEELHGMPSFAVPAAVGLIVVALGSHLIDPARPDVAGPATTLTALTLLVLVMVRLPGLVVSSHSDLVLENVAVYVKDAVVVFGVIYAMERVGGLRAAVIGIIAAASVLGLLTIYKAATGTSSDFFGFSRAGTSLITEEEGLRFTGPFLDPNYYAQSAVIAFGLATGLALGDVGRRTRLAMAGAMVLLLITVGLTFSRGGMLAIAAIGAVLAWRRYRLRAALPAVVVLVLFISFAPGATAERFQSVGEAPLAIIRGGDAVDPSLGGRTSEAFVAMQLFAEHPVFGSGAGTYEANYLDHANGNGIEIRRIGRAAHSLVLESAAELGLLGLLGLTIVAGSALAVPIHVRRRLEAAGDIRSVALADGIWLAVIGYLVTALFLHDAFSRSFVFVTGLGLATTMLQAGTREESLHV